MFGCIAAAAAAIVAISWFRRRRHCWRDGGPRGGLFGRSACGEYGGFRSGRAGMRRHLFRRLFQRIEATPGQERAVLDAAEAIEVAISKQAEAARSWRGATALAFDGERFDRTGIDAFFAEQEKAMAELRSTIAGKLAGVHEALEPDQRGEVARMIRNFGAHGRW